MPFYALPRLLVIFPARYDTHLAGIAVVCGAGHHLGGSRRRPQHHSMRMPRITSQMLTMAVFTQILSIAALIILIPANRIPCSGRCGR